MAAARRVFGPPRSGSVPQPLANSSGPSSERHSSDASGDTTHPEQNLISHLPLGSLHLGRACGQGTNLLSEMDLSSVGGTGRFPAVASGAFETEQSEGSMSVIAEGEIGIGSQPSNSRNLSSCHVLTEATEATREDTLVAYVQPYLDSRDVIVAEFSQGFTSADSGAPNVTGSADDSLVQIRRTAGGTGVSTAARSCSSNESDAHQHKDIRVTAVQQPSLTLKIAGIQ